VGTVLGRRRLSTACRDSHGVYKSFYLTSAVDVEGGHTFGPSLETKNSFRRVVSTREMCGAFLLDVLSRGNSTDGQGEQSQRKCMGDPITMGWTITSTAGQ
jgi:hypothetical protein